MANLRNLISKISTKGPQFRFIYSIYLIKIRFKIDEKFMNYTRNYKGGFPIVKAEKSHKFIQTQKNSEVEIHNLKEEIKEFRLYPKGDGTFKEFRPGEFNSKIPKFSFDETEQPELGTARETESEED